MLKEYQLRKLQNSYEVTLNYKGVKVRVAFTGGNVYKNTMPKFRTNNLFTMKAIEASELFKNKEVVLLRTIGEAPKPQNAMPQRSKKPAASEKKVFENPTPQTPQTPPTPPAVDDGLKELTFGNLGEAILYVAQNYDVSVQTESEVRKFLKDKNIKAVIKRG